MSEPVELCGENLKLKYRVHVPANRGGKGNYGGQSGHPIHVNHALPTGIRKRPKGRTRTP